MKKIILAVALFAIVLCSKAQIITSATSSSTIAAQVPGYSEVSTINTKTYSYTPSVPPTPPMPIDEDSTTEDDKLYRYGDNLSVNITMADGNITNTSVGTVWTVRISIPNALNIGLSFGQFNLSPTAEMYVFNEVRTVLDSAIKKEHFTSSSVVSIASLKGNSIIIYIVEPNNFGIFQSSISIQNLVAGFQELDDVGDTGGGYLLARASINCNPMIQCQSSKIPYARAVARFNTNGHQCTGTLINNESNNGQAYFLTAFHCIDANKNKILDQSEIDALAFATFQFHFWRTQCNGSINNRGLQFSGAALRASWENSDAVLLELLNPPGIGDLVNYEGWNRQTNAPADNGSFIIHHPQGEDMRITSTQNVRNWFWN